VLFDETGLLTSISFLPSMSYRLNTKRSYLLAFHLGSG
jgi:hypothetical protein